MAQGIKFLLAAVSASSQPPLSQARSLGRCPGQAEAGWGRLGQHGATWGSVGQSRASPVKGSWQMHGLAAGLAALYKTTIRQL